VIVTDVPIAPNEGLKPEITGSFDPVTVKLLPLWSVPFGVVTEIFPVWAAFGTATVIWVPLPLTPNPGAFVPPNPTDVAPAKLVPLIVTIVPTGPLVGLKLEIDGLPFVTVKLVPVTAVPFGVVTEIFPVWAAFGTATVIWVPLPLTPNPGAFVPPNPTDVVPAKLVPLIVTIVPTGPLVGLKLEMLGSVLAFAGRRIVTMRKAAIIADIQAWTSIRDVLGVRVIGPPPDGTGF
jgi:hypothetical protein